MTVSLVQTRGSRRAAGKVRHATSDRTSEAGPRAGLFETADRAVDPHAEDDSGRLPGASRSYEGKMLIAGVLEVNDGKPGRLRLTVIEDCSADTLHAVIA